MTDDVLAVITPSRFRRVFALGLLLMLGAVLIYLGFTESDAAGFVLRTVFVLLGAASLVMAQQVWRATTVSLILTEEGLADSDGRILVRTEDISQVERSAFAFKPSNGFAIKLTRPAERAYVPGLWWRYGRRLGVGGVIAKQEAKMMADIIALRLKVPGFQDEMK